MDVNQVALYIGYAVILVLDILAGYLGVIPKETAAATFSLVAGTFLTLHTVTSAQVKAIQSSAPVAAVVQDVVEVEKPHDGIVS